MGEPSLFQVVEVSLSEGVPEKDGQSSNPVRSKVYLHNDLTFIWTVPACFALSRLLFVKCRFIEGDSAASRPGGDESF